MAAKTLEYGRRAGRPLPTVDPAALQLARRLSDMREVGVLLRAERASRGLSQAEMAARLGVSRQSWSALETGAGSASAALVLQLLADLGVLVIALPAAAAVDPARALGLAPPG